NVYLALDPNQFQDTKYIFENVSHKATYSKYPMRVKVTSNRQVKWVIELLEIVTKSKNLQMESEFNA
ncbi:MAG: hypothetical protein IKC35_04090, partial [Clostridia bacterium]|nr:hypothetical protein [Clostridia bacterium]